MLGDRFRAADTPSDTPAPLAVCRRYGYNAAMAAAASARIVDILRTLTVQLRRQQASRSPYLVGDRLSCAISIRHAFPT